MSDPSGDVSTDRPFPPDRHLLRELDFEVRCVSEVEHVARFVPANPDAGEAGPVELGAVLTVADSLAGALCLRAVSLDWMATASLTFHLRGPLPAGELELSATVLRAGRTTVVVRVDGRVAGASGGGAAFGEGVVTFSRLIRRETNLTLERPFETGASYSFVLPGGARLGAGGSLRRAIGCRVVDRSIGATETEVVDYVRNSFGALNGGAICTIVETAALAFAGGGDPGDGDATIAPPIVTDIALHYLAQGRRGPVRTRVEALRPATSGQRGVATPSTVRVELYDAGVAAGPAEDALAAAPMVVAHVGVCPAGAQV